MGAMDWLHSREARDIGHDYHGNPTADLEALVKLYGLDQKTTPPTPSQMYRRAAGEVEARNVQSRMNMTPEERRAKAPWETQDTPDAQHIIVERYRD